MTCNESGVVSSLVNEIAALNATCPDLKTEAYRKKALQLTRKLAVVLQRPQTVPLNSILPVSSAAARIALDLNLFHLLADGTEPKTIVHLAAATKADPVLIDRVLRVLASIGWVEQVDDDSFKPTSISEHLIARKAIQAGVKHLFDVALPIFSKLPEYFRTHGYQFPRDEKRGPFQYAFNTDRTAFDWWAQDPVLSENFNTFMTGTAGKDKKAHWVNWFPVQDHLLIGARTGNADVLLVDVGGGRGHDLDTFMCKFPDAKGRYVLEDLPEVIDDNQHDNPRVELVKHSFLDLQPIEGARIYFLHHVLHNWPDDAAVQILSCIAAAMDPKYSYLIIYENCLPARDCPLWKAEMDWLMMATHCGMQRTLKEFHVMCEKAGLKLVKYWAPPGDGDGIIEAVKVSEN